MTAADGGLPLTGALPELAEVPWRPLADERSLRRADRRSTLWLAAQELPLLATAASLPLLSPVLIPMSLIALVFAWVIPDLWAAKGAEVLRPPRLPDGSPAGAQTRAIGLLGAPGPGAGDREVAAGELRIHRRARLLQPRRVVRRPLRKLRVAAMVQADESRHRRTSWVRGSIHSMIRPRPARGHHFSVH